MEHPGANVAAWNVETSNILISNSQPMAGDVALLFFHFHGFRQIDYLCYESGFEIYGAPLTDEVRGAVFEPYVMALLRIAKRQMINDGGSEVAVLPRRRELAMATDQLDGLRACGDEPVQEIAELQRRVRFLGQEIALLTEDLAVFARRIRFETAAAEGWRLYGVSIICWPVTKPGMRNCARRPSNWSVWSRWRANALVSLGPPPPNGWKR